LSDGHEHKEILTKYGEISLTSALLGIILTAPTGAIACSVAGPKLLEKETEAEKKKREEIENRNYGETELNERRKVSNQVPLTTGKYLDVDPKVALWRAHKKSY